MAVPEARGVRKVSESIMQNGRTIIITETNNDNLNWGRIPDGTLKVDPVTGQLYVKVEGESDWIPAGLNNDGSIQIVKDAKIGYEVYTVKHADNGDGTFTYVTEDGEDRVAPLTVDGWQTFELEKGSYVLKRNKLEVLLDDTLHRSVASGGLREIDEERFALEAVEDGTEITLKYIQNFSAASPYPRFSISEFEPLEKEFGDLWLDLSDNIE